MSTNPMNVGRDLASVTEAAHDTIRGRLLNFERSGDSYRAVVRANNRNIDIEIPNEIMESMSPNRHSVVAIDVGKADAGETPIAVSLDVVRHAQELPVDFEKLGHGDLEWRHLYIRSEKMLAAAQVRHLVGKYAREYLEAQGCINVQTPILTEASCVCSGDVFTFPYYGKKIATLIQSPWMYADAMTSGFDRVYTLNPSFRREKDASRNHLVEIWQMQVDMAWADNTQIMDMEEALLKHVATALKENHLELYELGGFSASHLDDILKPFSKVSYKDTVDIIKGLGFSMEHGQDYTREQESALAGQFEQPFFITDFPQKLKNFWFPVYEDNPELTPSNDLMAHTGHGEIIGGGERVSDAAQLEKNLKFFHHDLDEFGWFLDIRKYGCIPHAGFSIGFDRLVAFFLGADDITQASIFPRIPHGPIKP